MSDTATVTYVAVWIDADGSEIGKKTLDAELCEPNGKAVPRTLAEAKRYAAQVVLEADDDFLNHVISPSGFYIIEERE